MRKLGLLALFVASLWACDGTETSDNRSGSGGSGGTDGAVEIPTSVDATCRTYCANETGGMSCGVNGTAPDLSGGDTVQRCYENCLEHYEQQASLASRCEDEWIAILDCYVDLDCNDLFGDCDPETQAYGECGTAEPGFEEVCGNCPEGPALDGCEDVYNACAGVPTRTARNICFDQIGSPCDYITE